MVACHNAALRSAAAPGPSTDQEALQEDFLGPLQALGGSAGNGRLRELLTWEEATYEAVKASLLASGQLRRGRGSSVSLANGAADEGADGSASEAAESFAEPGGSVAAAEGSLAAAAIGKASALSAPPPGPCPPRHRPRPPVPPAQRQAEPLGLHLERGRPIAGRLQAERLRQGDCAVHGAAGSTACWNPATSGF